MYYHIVFEMCLRKFQHKESLTTRHEHGNEVKFFDCVLQFS
jgi:hypothetical protein